MRNSISIFGQTNNDLLLGVAVKIKDASTDVFIASTSPEGDQIQIHDNNDGTYYFDVTESFKGTVYVGSNLTAQDEMTNIMFYGDDVLAHLSEAGVHLTATEKSKVGNLPADTVENLTALESALQDKATVAALNALSSTVDGKASATPGTGMKSETGNKVAPKLHTDFLEVDTEGKLRIKQQFADEAILSNNKSLIENLMLLQSAIQNIGGIGEGGSVSFLNLTVRASHITSVPLGQAQLYFYYSDPEAASGTYGLYIAYNVSGTTVRYTIKETEWGVGSS